jgi:hypothetical protein
MADDQQKWEPPEKLKQILDSSITGRLEHVRKLEREERTRVANDMAARGLGRSPMGAAAVLKALQPAYREYADGVVDDLLGRIRDVYGTVPADAVSWIRAKFDERVMNAAPRLAHTIADSMGAKSGREHTEFSGEAFAAKRRLDQELLIFELKSEMQRVETLAGTKASTPAADVFICHASEDKEDIAIPIAQALEAEGFTVWIDNAQIKLGDRLLDTIEEGLRSCRFAAVILSPRFFQKHWTKIELAALATLQEIRGRKVILPIWHNIDKEGIAEHSLMLASLLGVSTKDGVPSVADAIVALLGDSK